MRFRPSRATAISLVLLCFFACSEPSEPPPPLPEFGITATITGAVNLSYTGVPSFGEISVSYGQPLTFEIKSESGGSQFITFWGESQISGRPTIGNFGLSVWREGIVGQRVHAEYRVRTPGGENAYYAVSGTLNVTASSPDAVVAEFSFNGVPGFLLPDSAVLRHDLPHVQVTGELTALCARTRCS
jgi:hypothetical protein